MKPGQGKGYWEQGFKGPKRVCDICGLTFYQETEMTKSRGLWLCTVGPRCIDDHQEVRDPKS